MNLVFLNGAILPAGEARISLFDRGFLYGDGLFETVRVQSGRPFRWASHLARLENGLRLLRIHLPYEGPALTRHATELIDANRALDAVLRLTVSRGPGPRGYSPAGADSPTVAMSLHPRPTDQRTEGRRLITSTIRLPAGDPLAAVKSACKLHHVLARAEADSAGADDALLLNHRGEIAEATSGNIFWMHEQTLFTPAPGTGLLPGIARGVVLDLASGMGIRSAETTTGREALDTAGSIFVTNMVAGPAEVCSLDGRKTPNPAAASELRAAFEELVRRETGER